MICTVRVKLFRIFRGCHVACCMASSEVTAHVARVTLVYDIALFDETNIQYMGARLFQELGYW
jgi:hypothetical protein